MADLPEKTQFIDTEKGLATLCEQLRGQPVLALDTEFLREKTYYAQLCLLQVAAEGVLACVDPLAVDLEPLLEIIYDPQVTKVMHSARQDMEIFFDLRGDVPRPLFDTQIAATLMGFGEQVGYANLVQKMLGVTLDKGATRTDWSQRPLDAEQIDYAADDVRYLFTVYHRQVEILGEKGRLEWLQADFDEMSDRSTYAPAPASLWKRVRGAQKLSSAQLAILRGLAVWREERAQASNRPRRWILKDEVMVDIARRAPDQLSGLAKIRGIEERLLKRHGEALLQVIAEARASDPAGWPQKPQGRRLNPEQEAVVDMLMAVLRLRGLAHDVSPALLAGRKQVEALVAGDTDLPVLHGWRAELVGHDLQAVLAGEKVLRVVQGRVEVSGGVVDG
ncbi:MAG TPA: ribonuclease D [Gammaproteobacteria bacterium]|nr:ribonuclease D [Gammaproteobacteria bacterium]